MKFYFSPSDNPYYNNALEEFLLLSSEEDILLCYINRPALVVGRFQVPYREIDAAYLHLNGIDLVRRLSGGGSVYHDSGNLNYSYITHHQEQKENAYDKFNAITIAILKSIGLTDLGFERNNIFCQGKKISGVAQYKRKHRMVHHGTLLVEADLTCLRRLFVKKNYYHTKAIPSVSSSVANVNEFVNAGMQELRLAFQSYCSGTLLPELDMVAILDKKKSYEASEWVIGKSPLYRIEQTAVKLQVEKGIITASESHPELIGEQHYYERIKTKTEHPELLF